MPRIVIPTDFSDTSASALRFATYLAETMDLDLLVVHVFDPLETTDHTLSAVSFLREERRLAEKLKQFAHRHVDPVLATFQGRLDILPAVRARILHGVAGPKILWESAQDETELIVMGGIGAGAGQRAPGLFGSAATMVATKGGCPVILIPAGYGYPRVEKMAIAFDAAGEIRKIGGITRRIIKALRPEVHFVHVRHPDARAEASNEAAFFELSWGAGFPSYTFKLDALPEGPVVSTLLSYTRDKDINLLVLGGERRGFFKSLFQPGHLRPLVKRCEVPLLIVPYSTQSS